MIHENATSARLMVPGVLGCLIKADQRGIKTYGEGDKHHALLRGALSMFDLAGGWEIDVIVPNWPAQIHITIRRYGSVVIGVAYERGHAVAKNAQKMMRRAAKHLAKSLGPLHRPEGGGCSTVGDVPELGAASSARTSATAAEWNALHPVDTAVRYEPVKGGNVLETRTRSAAWELGGGHVVVLLEGLTGGKSIQHITAIPKATWNPGPDTHAPSQPQDGGGR